MTSSPLFAIIEFPRPQDTQNEPKQYLSPTMTQKPPDTYNKPCKIFVFTKIKIKKK